jgi:antiviral helicase SLH1
MYASRMEYFNPIQTQCFDTVYNTRKSVFIGAPSGCDKQVLAELAIFKEL